MLLRLFDLQDDEHDVYDVKRAMSAVGLCLGVMLLAPGLASAQCSAGGAPIVSAPTSTVIRSMPLLLETPSRMAVAPSGNILVTDPKAGVVLSLAPTGATVGYKRQFLSPLAIAATSSGTILLGEQGAGRVTIFDSNWAVVSRLGSGDGEFVNPTGIAVDPNPAFGKIYVTDGEANVVKIFQPSGQYISSFGVKGTDAGQFDFPSAVYVSAGGEVFVGDQNNDRIEVFDRDGAFQRCFGRGGGMLGPSKVGTIQALTGDSLGRIYIADSFQGYVQVMDSFGASLTTIGAFGRGPAGELQTPMGLAIAPTNRLFVTSYNSSRIEVFGLDAFSEPPQITADALTPSVIMASPAGPITNQSPIPVTVTFNEPVVGFDASALLVANANVGNFSGSGGAYTFDLTPLGQGAISAGIAAAVCKDVNGNNNSSASFSIVYDSVPPTATVAVVGSNPTTADALVYAFQFSEDMGGAFSAANVSLAAGSIPGTMGVSGGGSNFYVTVTPADSNANGTVSLNFLGVVKDAAGNPWTPAGVPVIVVHNWPGFAAPPADARLYTGDFNTLSAEADFGPIVPTFQWVWNNGMTGVQLGPITPLWLLNGLTPLDQGTYWCQVTYDGAVYETPHALVSVANHLAVGAVLQGGTEQIGTPYTFSVSTSGGYSPLAYIWSKDGSIVSGAGESWYTVTPLTAADSGFYTVDILDSNGEMVSSSAVLEVVAKVPLAGFFGLGLLAAAFAALGVSRTRRA